MHFRRLVYILCAALTVMLCGCGGSLTPEGRGTVIVKVLTTSLEEFSWDIVRTSLFFNVKTKWSGSGERVYAEGRNSQTVQKQFDNVESGKITVDITSDIEHSGSMERISTGTQQAVLQPNQTLIVNVTLVPVEPIYLGVVVDTEVLDYPNAGKAVFTCGGYKKERDYDFNYPGYAVALIKDNDGFAVGSQWKVVSSLTKDGQIVSTGEKTFTVLPGELTVAAMDTVDMAPAELFLGVRLAPEPPAPANLAATKQTGIIRVSWTSPYTCALYRSPKDKPTNMKRLGFFVGGYDDTDADPSKSYLYWVQAINLQEYSSELAGPVRYDP